MLAVKGKTERKSADGSIKEDDILVSQYNAGQKEALRAVFKQRTQNEPVCKEVKVQLLENQISEKTEMGAQNNQLEHCSLQQASAAAAATAAAVAATVPLFKVHNDLEAKIASVAELVTKLQETDRQMQNVAEQQAHVQVQETGWPHHRERVFELEKQLNSVIEQRIEHLEKLQQQQLQLQSCFMNSAISTNSRHALSVHPACFHSIPHSSTAKSTSKGFQWLPSNSINYSHTRAVPSESLPVATVYGGQLQKTKPSLEKSPLETPAPRKFAPVPMSKENGSAPLVNLGNGRFLEDILNKQETPVRQTESVEKVSVSMTTAGSNPQSSGILLTESFPALGGPSRGSELVEGISSTTVQKATEVLHDLGRLKREMQSILQEGEQWRSEIKGFTKPAETFSMKQRMNTSQNITPRTIDPVHIQHPLAEGPVNANCFTNTAQLAKPSLLQSVEAPKSMFFDAERILREVKNNKKVLEENLEAIIRAKDGNAMYTLISALSANRDAAEEIRVRKTVDAWIAAISKDIEDEIARNELIQEKKRKEKEQQILSLKKGQSAEVVNPFKVKAQKKLVSLAKKPATSTRILPKQSTETCGKQNLISRPVSQSFQNTVKTKVPPQVNEALLQDEDYLSRVYGKAVYQGHRSTLKKGPYIRLNSPSPRSKAQRPKVVESIKGVKVKSARTQTHLLPTKSAISSPPQHPLSAPLIPTKQYVFSPVRELQPDAIFSGPLEGHLIPVAVPLGQPRIDGTAPQPSGVFLTTPQPVTITTSILPSPPKAQSKVKKPNIAVVEMRSEKKDPPKLNIQVLPNVDIDSITSGSSDVSKRSPSPSRQAPTLPPAQTVIQSPEPDDEEDEGQFPGSDFLAVADVTQMNHENEDVSPESPEPPIELNGWSEPFAVNHGLVFPPSVPVSQPTVDIVDKMIRERETVENRVINWVEQEIMSRIITEMYPVREEPLAEISVSESSENQSAHTDIVEAAGGGGFQLFVDAGVPVNSDLIRQFVNEALAETVAILLGQREGQHMSPTPLLPESKTPLPEMCGLTPVATPQATPPDSPPPPPVKVSSPVKTPVMSPQTSIEFKETESKPFQEPELGAASDKSIVGTPVATPMASPPRVVTPTPPTSENISEASITQNPEPVQQVPKPWGDVELPLAEENPNSASEKIPQPEAITLSVANDEEPTSLVAPLPVINEVPSQTLREPTPAPPAHSPVYTPSLESTSSTISITETETVDRPISEGEVLITYRQIIAARALAEGGVPHVNLNTSLSSTLQDAQDMDYDSPSEGQVIKKPHRGHHRDPVLGLLANMNQDPVIRQALQFHSQSSDEECSGGEISEGQRPQMTVAAEFIMTGHSVYMDQPALSGLRNERRRHTPSPEQLNRTTGDVFDDSLLSHGPMSLGELETRPVPLPHVQQMTHFSSRPVDVEHGSQRLENIQVIQVESRAEDSRTPGLLTDLDRTNVAPDLSLTSDISGSQPVPSSQPQAVPVMVSVTLPSMNEEDQADSVSTIDADTDSSGADTF
ncbi:protein TALPID3 [Protopterus annectens]|uniref:protein TALPID3 n=1 Tax=Protopterus annectens TaxID=7888 RepID=UPI001CFAD864|nr:protein TALPID3 [Protopterus annectens]